MGKTTANTDSKSAGKRIAKNNDSAVKKKSKQPKEHRSYMIAFLLVLLAVFEVIGWFKPEAAILNFLFNLERGLFGYGVYLLPVSLAYIAFFLSFRNISEKIRETVAISLLPLEIGSLCFLFRYPEELWIAEKVKGLWLAAIDGEAGGFVTGCLGAGFRWCFSTIGAAILLCLLLIWSVLALFNLSPLKLFVQIRKAMPGEPEESREEALVNKAVERKTVNKQKKEEARQKNISDLAGEYAGGSRSGAQQEPVNVRLSKLKSQQIVVEELPPDEPFAFESELESTLFAGSEFTPEPTLESDIHSINSSRNGSPIFPDEDFEEASLRPNRTLSENALDEDNELITDKIRKNSNLKSGTKSDFEKDLTQVERHMEPFEPDPFPGPYEDSPEFEFEGLKQSPDFEGQMDPEELSLDMNPAYPPEKPEPEEEPISYEEEDRPGETEPVKQLKVPDAVSVPVSANPTMTVSASGEYVYRFPPMDCLKLPKTAGAGAKSEIEGNKQRLADTLNSFGIEPNIQDVVCGPTVTRYELKLNPGVKLSKITNLSDDIALALGVSGVRIAAIPEKISVVGIEVPNKTVSVVSLREVLDSPEFKSSKSPISFALGKDISGNRIISNISKLPHLLIGGTTGSGKSVCMNSLIISLLYKANPEDVKLIMIDPKMVELGIYNGIPHLLLPVVTDPKKASGSLQWAVNEMLRRYSVMASMGIREIDGYNKKIAHDPNWSKMPHLVVVIDELADLMMAAAKEVEESVCRIAQMGRAAGVHLVIATQRPSVNVITGLMKANVPSRIAFSVPSAMESRIVLDVSGAEKLVGRGDMLYAPIGEGKPKRVQGCYVSDEEVAKVALFVKSCGCVKYDERIEKEIEERAKSSSKPQNVSAYGDEDEGYGDSERDELLFDAVDVFMEMNQASTSVLQRRLKVGYARASRIVDQMEELGIVGPHKGSKPRDMLISKEKWQAVKDGLMELEDALSNE